MVMRHVPRARTGVVLLELVIALGIIAGTMLPVAYSIVQEQRVARAYYFRAVAISIVDGEMEVLAAGGWRGYAQGRQIYRPHAQSVATLPPGQFTLELSPAELRLEWRPAKAGHGGTVVRALGLKRPQPSPPPEL